MYTPTPTIPPITICNSIFEIKDNTNTSNKKIKKERIKILYPMRVLNYLTPIEMIQNYSINKK